MKVGNKIILLSFLIVTTTVNAREPRTERTPYVQEANIVFDELELAFKQKDFPTIERLLTHLSNTAKRDGNLEDLASSYVELTDFFVERGAYDKAQKYYDLSLPVQKKLAHIPEEFSKYLWQVRKQAEMYQQKGNQQEGLRRIQTQLPAIEALLVKYQNESDFKEHWNGYLSLVQTGFDMVLDKRKSAKNASKVQDSEPLAQNLNKLLRHVIMLDENLTKNKPKIKSCNSMFGMASFGFYRAQELSAFQDYFKHCYTSSGDKNNLRYLGIAYSAQGKYQQAIDAYEQMLLKDSNAKDVVETLYWTEIGDIYQKNKQPEQAKLAFEQAFEHYQVEEKNALNRDRSYNPLYEILHLGRYYSQLDQQKYEQFFDQRINAWKSQPQTQASILGYRSEIEFSRKNYSRAEEDALAALKLVEKPDEYGGYTRNTVQKQLIDIYTEQGKIPQAAQVYLDFFMANHQDENSSYNFTLPKYVEWATEHHLESQALRLVQDRLHEDSAGGIVEGEILRSSLVQPLTKLFQKQGEKYPLEKAHQFIDTEGVWIH